MFIDICLLALIVLAIFKGMKKGLVVAAFSFFAIFLGLAAAVKMSTLVAGWLSETVNIKAAWLPFLAFILIMIAVSIVVRIVAAIIETTLQLTLLGWLNSLGGIVLYCCIYVTVFSVLIFYMEQLHLLKEPVIASSKTYQYIHFWGPKAIDLFGKLVPVFKGMFEELTQFFDSLKKNLA
ncbi:MAG: CvpA family protein [Sphingobacteriia bacterium]|jgi:membrane protein required for colicin V production